MSGREYRIPPTLVWPRIRIDIDDDGHLDVQVDGEPWEAPVLDGGGREIPLGRSDVPWALDRIARGFEVPLRIELHDGDRTYTDILLPESLRHDGEPSEATPPGDADATPPGPDTSDRTAPDADGVPRSAPGLVTQTGDGFLPGEPVQVAVVVSTRRADDDGQTTIGLPAALRDIAGPMLLFGATSGTTVVLGEPAGASASAGPKPAMTSPYQRSSRQARDVGQNRAAEVGRHADALPARLDASPTRDVEGP